MSVYAYLRVSTLDQDNDKFKLDLLEYANSKTLGQIEFVEEKITGTKHWRQRKLGELLSQLVSGDILLVPELSRLARSIAQIYEIINECIEKGITIHILKQNMVIGNGKMDMTTKVMLSTFSMIAELERDFISIRTKEALASKKKQGIKLGRPKGRGKSRLDEYRDEIMGMLHMGVTKKKIAEKYGVSVISLYNWQNNRRVTVNCQ